MTTLSQLHAQLITGDGSSSSELAADGAIEQLAEITVAGVLHITYRAGRITPRMLRGLASFVSGDFDALPAQQRLAALDALTDYLASTIVAWDLEADDGSGRILPATRDGLDDVDYRVQVVILQAIVGNEQLPKARATRSQPASFGTPARSSRVTSQRRSARGKPKSSASRR